MALLRTETDIQLDNFTRPICVPETPTEPTNRICIVAGFGFTS